MAEARVDITVNVHLEGAKFVARATNFQSISLSVEGDRYPSVTLFGSTEDMARLRDELDAYLGANTQALAA